MDGQTPQGEPPAGLMQRFRAWWNKQSRGRKAATVALAAIIGMWVVVSAVNSFGGQVDQSRVTTSTETTATVEVVTKATSESTTNTTAKPSATTTTTVGFAKAQLTDQTVKAALAQQIKDVKPITAAEVNGTEVLVIWTPEALWNEKSVVKNEAKNAAKIFRILFSNPKVTGATFATNVTVTDAYGKKVIRPGVSIFYKRATVEKIKWDNFPTEWQNVYHIADFYSIDSAVYRGLDGDYLIPQSQGTLIE